MLDIEFYQKAWEVKKILSEGHKASRYTFNRFESFRSENPIIYDIESTNDCNMVCKMCPRSKMTRPIHTMSMSVYNNIVSQIEPFTPSQLSEWEKFVTEKYKVLPTDMSENHFLMYVIAKSIVLHGYGEPLLDPYIVQRVQALTDKGIPSYFSCNPANVNIPKLTEVFKAGLGHLKFSIDSVSDTGMQNIRGKHANYVDSYNKILQLLEIIANNNYKTQIVITMLNFNEDEYLQLMQDFEGLDVYIYLKSLDQNWLHGIESKTKSIHWSELCQFPWSTMSVHSNGDIVACPFCYNNDLLLGNTTENSLHDIWNSDKYKQLREDHFNFKPSKCTEACDLKILWSYR